MQPRQRTSLVGCKNGMNMTHGCSTAFSGSDMWAYIQHIFLSLLKNVPYDSVFHLNINPDFQPFHLLSMTINTNYQMQPWIFAKIGFIKWNSCCNFKDKSLISCLQNTNSLPMVFSTSDKEKSQELGPGAGMCKQSSSHLWMHAIDGLTKVTDVIDLLPKLLSFRSWWLWDVELNVEKVQIG